MKFFKLLSTFAMISLSILIIASCSKETNELFYIDSNGEKIIVKPEVTNDATKISQVLTALISTEASKELMTLGYDINFDINIEAETKDADIKDPSTFYGYINEKYKGDLSLIMGIDDIDADLLSIDTIVNAVNMYMTADIDISSDSNYGLGEEKQESKSDFKVSGNLYTATDSYYLDFSYHNGNAYIKSKYGVDKDSFIDLLNEKINFQEILSYFPSEKDLEEFVSNLPTNEELIEYIEDIGVSISHADNDEVSFYLSLYEDQIKLLLGFEEDYDLYLENPEDSLIDIELTVNTDYMCLSTIKIDASNFVSSSIKNYFNQTGNLHCSFVLNAKFNQKIPTLKDKTGYKIIYLKELFK